MFQQVRQVGMAGWFMAGAHVVPELDCGERGAVVFTQIDSQAVIQCEVLQRGLGGIRDGFDAG
ncbi:hypothetical protein D3C81_1483760 [compost metagenome]